VEIYETEEEQIAAIKRWWKENGASTIAGVVIGLLLLGGWNFWQSYKQDQANQASSFYVQLNERMDQKKFDSVEKIAQTIMTQYSSTAYASYAALLLAKTKVEQGNLEAAKAIFEKLMLTASEPELKQIARIRLIKIMYAEDNYQQGLQLIAEADPSSIEGFSMIYDELKGDLYVALDRLGEARTAYQSALRAGARSPLLQFKLDDISAQEVITKS